MTILKAIFRYILLFILINESTPGRGQSIDTFTLVQSVGCFPYPLLATSGSNSASPVVERIWYLTTCSGTPVITTPPGIDSTFAGGPTNPGCYCLRLWTKYQNGDTSSYSKCNIIEDDTALINASLASLSEFCINSTATLNLNNTSACGTIDTTEIFWSCGAETVVGGNPGTVSHFYGGNCIPQCYNVTVIVKNSCGCYSSKIYPSMLCAIPPPQANFTADTTFAVCVGSLTTHFTADSTDPDITYCWYVNGVQKQCNTSRLFTYTFTSSPTCYDIKLTVSHPSGCTDSLTRTGYICVQSTPVLTFSENDTSICLLPGQKTQLCLTNTSQGLSNPTWRISPGGITGTGNTFCDSLSTFGSYSVTMIGTFTAGCTDSVVKANAFIVNQSPVACYTTTDTFSCTVPYCVNITNCSTPPGSTYAWNFSGASNPSCTTCANPIVCYDSYYGQRFITLYTTAPNGCTRDFSMTTPIVIDTLVPSFIINHSKGCSPLTTTISNSTNGQNYPDPIKTYTWSFPGSNPPIPNQTGPSITQAFTQPGCYNVQLQLTTAAGCTPTTRLNDTICVGTPPNCTLTANPLTKCYDSLPVYFTVHCDSFDVAIAYFGNGEGAPASFHEDSIPHIYQSYGEFDAWVVTMKDSCPSDTMRVHISVHPPVANFKDSTSCLTGDTVYLINESQRATSYSWQFSCLAGTDTSTNPILLMPNCVSCYVELTAYNDSFNCQYTKRDSITTSCNGPPSFTPVSVSGCSPFKPTFTNTTSGASQGTTYWNFDINNNSPLCPAVPGCITGTTITPPVSFGPGTTEMAMVFKAPGGCLDTLYRFIHTCRLTAGFSPTNICLPDSFHFQGFATDSFCDGKFTWRWNFGGGDTSALQNPVQYYVTAGQYPVTLTVTDSTGCSATVTQNVNVGTAVFSNWSFDSTICPNLQVCITNNTTSPVPMTETWYFPGSATDSFVGHTPPCITYPNEGDFPIIYDVVAGTCDKSDTQYVHVHTPIVQATVSTNFISCANNTFIVTVNNMSQYVDRLTDSVTWTFFDTVTHKIYIQSPEWEPEEIFPVPGVYVVSLCVLTNNGCQVCGIIDTIVVQGPYGNLSFSTTNVCTCTDSVTFTVATIKASSVTLLPGCNQGYQKDTIVPEGTIQNPVVLTFKAPYCVSGICPVQLYFQDTTGCYVLFQNSPVVYVDSPAANFGFSKQKVCNSGTVSFYDSTSYYFGPDTSVTVSWLWNFGDGSASSESTQQNPAHYYSQPGTYQVKLIVTSNFGCTDSITKQIIIYPRPVANFSLSDSVVCSNQSVCLTDNSTSTVPIATWQWLYGDNFDTTTQSAPCHTYSAPFLQFYNLQLVVTDTNGCTDTASHLLQMNVSPQANFSWLPTCDDSLMALNDLAIPGSNVLNFCQWTLWLGAPNPVIDNNCNTSFQFVQPGLYPVQFIVGDANGCFDTIVKTVESDARTELSVTPGDTTVCLGSSVSYSLNGTFNDITWTPNIWVTPLDASQVDSSHVLISPLGDVEYEVQVQSGVCAPVSDIFSINVIQPLPPIEVTAAPPRVFLGLSSDILSQIQRQDSVIQIDSIIWTPDTSLSCNNCMNPIATPRQTTTYTVTVYYSQNGYTCTTSAQVTIEVIYSCDSAIIFIPNTFTPNGDGKNDIFMIRGMGGTTIKYFRIFDRWGNLLFGTENAQLNDAQFGWNGNDMNGRKLNDGVYVYEYQIECINRELITGQGNVTLVR